MATEADEKASLAIPAQQDPKVVVNGERPIVPKVALELVRMEQGIPGVCGESTQRGPKQLVLRRFELLGAPGKPR